MDSDYDSKCLEETIYHATSRVDGFTLAALHINESATSLRLSRHALAQVGIPGDGC
jgi:hypothetical protein